MTQGKKARTGPPFHDRIGGKPADDDPRRCSHIMKLRHNKQCSKWGLQGTNPPLCQMHGGRMRQSAQTAGLHKRWDWLPVVYKRRLGPALKAAINEQLNVDPDEQIAVWEELALLREHAAAYVSLFNTAYEQNEAEPTPERQARVIAAGAGMSEALVMVTEVAAKAGKINDKLKDRFSVHDLNYVIERILVLHHQTIGKDNPLLSKRFAEAVEREQIVPRSETGTKLTPDDTAREYDASVPLFDSEAS